MEWTNTKILTHMILIYSVINKFSGTIKKKKKFTAVNVVYYNRFIGK